ALTSGTPQHRVKRAAATDWYPLPTVQYLSATSYPPAEPNATSLFPGLTPTWAATEPPSRGPYKFTLTTSHPRDPADTPDPILRAKRTLLAEADSLATLAHQLLPLTNYAHLIIPDYWELRDDHDRPITGATAPWLGAIYGRRDWPKAQARKPDTRQTIQPLRIPTGDICKWDHPALTFYWRAICYTLHTNARKHRIHPRWEPHCRTCPASIDTQEHRFGLSHPICPMSVPLSQQILLATQAILPKAWLPDQDIYLPGHSTATAHILPGLKRPQWKSRGGNPSPNTGTCMIPLTAQRCVHALHMQRLLGPPHPESLMLAASQLSWEYHQCPKPGLLLPRWLYHTALRSTPLLAPRDFWFGQWMGGPNGATFHGPLGRSPHCIIPRPPTNHHWWIDATHNPYPSTWWRLLTLAIQEATTHHTPATYWFVVPDGSRGHTTAEQLQTTWLLTIPPRQLSLRHTSSIHHTSTPHWGTLATGNPTPLHIGFFTTGNTLELLTTAQLHWTATLQLIDATHWLHRPPPTTLLSSAETHTVDAPRLLTAPTHCLHWAQTAIPDYDPYALDSRAFLTATYPTIYHATPGWTTFPTMTHSTQAWAASITHLRAPLFHTQWFVAHWAVLRRHWQTTCATNVDHIRTTGELPLLTEVNNTIRLKRRYHDAAPMGHDRRIRARRAHLTAKTLQWHSRRISLLQPAIPPPIGYADPTLRPPRLPPDPGLPPPAE
ncbi:hypothetical protein DYB34_004075, partial [Aphanomyces astaci]